jgi:hypothetical protein
MHRRLAIGLGAFMAVGFLAARALSLPRHDLPAAAPETSAEPMPARQRVGREPPQRGVALEFFAQTPAVPWWNGAKLAFRALPS